MVLLLLLLLLFSFIINIRKTTKQLIDIRGGSHANALLEYLPIDIFNTQHSINLSKAITFIISFQISLLGIFFFSFLFLFMKKYFENPTIIEHQIYFLFNFFPHFPPNYVLSSSWKRSLSLLYVCLQFDEETLWVRRGGRNVMTKACILPPSTQHHTQCMFN